MRQTSLATLCGERVVVEPEHRPATSSKSRSTPAGNRCKLLLGAASSFVGLVGSSVRLVGEGPRAGLHRLERRVE